MKKYRIDIPADVEKQIFEQVFYIAKHSVDRAFAWEARLVAAIKSVCNAPGYAINEEASAKYHVTIRQYVFERNHIVEYRIDEEFNVITILEIRHTARLPRKGEP